MPTIKDKVEALAKELEDEAALIDGGELLAISPHHAHSAARWLRALGEFTQAIRDDARFTGADVGMSRGEWQDYNKARHASHERVYAAVQALDALVREET